MEQVKISWVVVQGCRASRCGRFDLRQTGRYWLLTDSQTGKTYRTWTVLAGMANARTLAAGRTVVTTV